MSIAIPTSLTNIYNTLIEIKLPDIVADHYAFAVINNDNKVESIIISSLDSIQELTEILNINCVLCLQQHTYSPKDFPGAFCHKGFNWDPLNKIFYAPQPYPSWILNIKTCKWESPEPYPNNTENLIYYWNESELCWKSSDPNA